jgi:hypothetical protein
LNNGIFVIEIPLRCFRIEMHASLCLVIAVVITWLARTVLPGRGIDTIAPDAVRFGISFSLRVVSCRPCDGGKRCRDKPYGGKP